MTVAAFSFLGIVLFMIHEFDEIIFVRAWIKACKDSRNVSDIWNRSGDKVYPSTAALALMIAEEFILLSILFGLCILFEWPEFAAGIIIAYALHLFGHLAEAAKSKRWSPGAPTAAATLPLIAVLILMLAAANPFDPLRILPAAVLTALILLFNIIMLHKAAPRMQKFIDSVYN